MKLKMAFAAAGAATLVAAGLATLPAGATHTSGFAQTVNTKLSLPPGLILTTPNPVVCLDGVCETVDIPDGPSVAAIHVDWVFQLLGSSTHLPTIGAATGAALPCPGSLTNKKSPGIDLSVDPHANQRYNNGAVTITTRDVNGNPTAHPITVPTQLEDGTGSDPGFRSFAFYLDC